MYTTICTFFSNAFTKTTEPALFRNKQNLKQQQKPIVNSLIIIWTFFLKQTSTMWKQYRMSGHVQSRRDWSMRSSQYMSLSSFTHVCSYNSLSVRVKFLDNRWFVELVQWQLFKLLWTDGYRFSNDMTPIN